MKICILPLLTFLLFNCSHSVRIYKVNQPTQTVYIDPTFIGTSKTGTQTNPLTILPNSLVGNTVYLIKGGTTLQLNQNNAF